MRTSARRLLNTDSEAKQGSGPCRVWWFHAPDDASQTESISGRQEFRMMIERCGATDKTYEFKPV